MDGKTQNSIETNNQSDRRQMHEWLQRNCQKSAIWSSWSVTTLQEQGPDLLRACFWPLTSYGIFVRSIIWIGWAGMFNRELTSWTGLPFAHAFCTVTLKLDPIPPRGEAYSWLEAMTNTWSHCVPRLTSTVYRLEYLKVTGSARTSASVSHSWRNRWGKEGTVPSNQCLYYGL